MNIGAKPFVEPILTIRSFERMKTTYAFSRFCLLVPASQLSSDASLGQLNIQSFEKGE